MAMCPNSIILGLILSTYLIAGQVYPITSNQSVIRASTGLECFALAVLNFSSVPGLFVLSQATSHYGEHRGAAAQSS